MKDIGKETFYWLALNSIHGVGKTTFKTLIRRYGSPLKVFETPIEELQERAGIPPRLAKEIKGFKKREEIEEELALAETKGVKILTLNSKSYPNNLLEIYDPPPYLYIKGAIREEDHQAVAVVGARSATSYGKEITKRICRELAAHNITVVSGMARGIDTAAHTGAIEGGGRTIAVLGCGIDVIYPPENSGLFQSITGNGAVISEFPMAAPPLSRNFPMRNRIISGLSLGTVIVEASMRSGSLITARLALEQGREVFAIPGNITSNRSHGTNRLIKQGAKLVENIDDILEELIPQIEGRKNSNPIVDKLPEIALCAEEKGVLETLNHEPKHIDTIIRESRLNSSKVSVTLLNMEIKGIIKGHPGKYYTKNFETS
ncbi:MAG: DNA-processing protein DprA [Thermodesulfobacteriota bacterium]